MTEKKEQKTPIYYYALICISVLLLAILVFQIFEDQANDFKIEPQQSLIPTKSFEAQEKEVIIIEKLITSKFIFHFMNLRNKFLAGENFKYELSSVLSLNEIEGFIEEEQEDILRRFLDFEFKKVDFTNFKNSVLTEKTDQNSEFEGYFYKTLDKFIKIRKKTDNASLKEKLDEAEEICALSNWESCFEKISQIQYHLPKESAAFLENLSERVKFQKILLEIQQKLEKELKINDKVTS